MSAPVYESNSRIMETSTLFTSLLQSDLGDSDFRLIGWENIKANAPAAGPLNIPEMMGEVEQEFAKAGKPLVANVDQMFTKFAEKLKPELKVIQFPEEQLQITELRLTEVQERLQTHYENEALEKIWKTITFQLDFAGGPEPTTHQEIRQWLKTPENAAQLGRIAILHLGYNYDLGYLNLRTLPPEMNLFTGLIEIDLQYNKFSVLPDSLRSLNTLQTLNLMSNQLSSLPEWLGELTQLQTLYLTQNKLKTLPDSIGKLTALQTLAICNNQLESLPDSFCDLTALRCFSAFHNRLSALPDQFGNLKALWKIELHHNEIKGLPDSFGGLSTLRVLELHYNQLSSLPDSFDRLAALRELTLSFNQFCFFPDSIGNLTALNTLSLSNNQLTSIPDSLSRFTELRQLFLSNNQLTSLPDSFGNLPATLYPLISNNPLLFISEQELQKSRLLSTIAAHHQAFMDYPSQSSLANLFQLIIRNEEVANTFDELDEALKERIIALAANESSQGPSQLPPIASSSSDTAPLFANLPRFARAVRKATYEKFEALSQEQKSSVYQKIWELAGRPEADPVIWGENHAYEHVLRFIDAMEEVTKQNTWPA